MKRERSQTDPTLVVQNEVNDSPNGQDLPTGFQEETGPRSSRETPDHEVQFEVDLDFGLCHRGSRGVD